MKAIAALLLVAAICQLGHANVAHPKKLAPRSIGDKFKQALEDFKKIIKTGNATMGIPVLDPLDLKHYKFNIENKLAKLKGEVNDFFLEGLANYIINNADFKFVGKTVSVDFLWSSISGKTKYNVVDSLVLQKFPAYGNGELTFEASEFHFATEASVKINLKADRLSIMSFNNTVIALGNLEVDLTGLYNDDELSTLISAVINDNAVDFLADFNGDIVNGVEKVMKKTANDILKDKSLKELMKIIKG